ncbi:unnamed protein product [Oreochromis niloticus]|nr:unnamed protein product [Mustela putorius furo]
MEAESQGSAIIPFALPKGAEKFCELCQREARLQCSKCRVTFYCAAEHQQADWVGIHKRICQLLVPIRALTLRSLQQTSHTETQIKKAELIEICRLVAQSKLSEGKHQEALPAAQLCLRCSIDVHGPNTVQLVPAYLLLAEANMGLGNLDLVADFLSQAEWAVLKSPKCGLTIHHQLHRSLGRLHVATGDLETALHNFANDGKMPTVRSLYSEVARIWHCHLTRLLETRKESIQNPPVDSFYDKAERVEVDEMLRTMLEFEQKDTRKDPARIAVVAHCLAMLSFLGGDFLKAQGFGSTALQASQLIPDHDLTEPIQALLQLVKILHTVPHPGSAESQY